MYKENDEFFSRNYFNRFWRKLKMLTVEQKNNNEIKFMELLARLNTDLTGIHKLLDAVDFFNKPASAQYGGAYPGGLCEHALKVAHELGVLCNAYFPGRYTEEDVIKVALLKDIYKASMYEPFMRNVKNEETGQWETVPAYRVKEGTSRPVYGELGFSSYMQVKSLIPLTDEQIEAIVYSKISDFAPDIYDIFRVYPLVTLTRMAEMAATYIN
jgi:hypothetical protein